jgi:hypothetical protein
VGGRRGGVNRGIRNLAQFIARRVKPGSAARYYFMNEAVGGGDRGISIAGRKQSYGERKVQ